MQTIETFSSNITSFVARMRTTPQPVTFVRNCSACGGLFKTVATFKTCCTPCLFSFNAAVN